MTGLVSPETAKAFKDSALETADLGRTQVELGASKYGKNAGIDSASAMIYGESSPQATFYADQQRVQQKQFDAILQKQKAQAEVEAQAQAELKASALAKLAELGLTEDEAKAIAG
jgi:hypothetical protein